MDSEALREAFDLFVKGWPRPWNYVAGVVVFSAVMALALRWWGVI